MDPEELPVPKEVQDALYALLGEGWDNKAEDVWRYIEQLQKVISEPVERFGTPELIAWVDGLQKILSDFPEDERGNWPFCLTMGNHLEKFAKSWNSPVMRQRAEQIATLKAVLRKERTLAIQNNPNRTYEWTYEAAETRANEQLAQELPEIFEERENECTRDVTPSGPIPKEMKLHDTTIS